MICIKAVNKNNETALKFQKIYWKSSLNRVELFICFRFKRQPQQALAGNAAFNLVLILVL